MLNIRTSKTDTPSPTFVEAERKRGDNLAWIEPHLRGDDVTHLLLLGGVGPVDFRLRVAQSHARADLTPSHWSHVALLGARSEQLGNTPIFEISLTPENGFGYPPPTNAVQQSTLKRYRNVRRYPNIAIIRVPVPLAEVQGHLKRWAGRPAVLGAVALLALWLSCVWGVNRAGDAPRGGRGMPSATVSEYVGAAAGFDRTPGLASRSSCPEALWQSARWWHEF